MVKAALLGMRARGTRDGRRQAAARLEVVAVEQNKSYLNYRRTRSVYIVGAGYFNQRDGERERR